MNAFAAQRFGKLRRVSQASPRGLALLCCVAAFLACDRADAASLQDIFANRETVTNASGTITGDNSAATVEVGEPQIGGKPGGHSLWISWVAPTDGIVTFRTDGSSFDTTLSGFYFGSTNDTTVDKLHEAARNDDYPGIQPQSLIEFGVLAGRHYEIGIDGFYGATGSVQLAWSFVSATQPPPTVLSVSSDQAARQGDTVTLSVALQTFGSVQLRWRLNEVDLVPEVNTTNLVISSLQPTNVGRYDLRIKAGGVTFFSTPTEIQINSDGDTNSLAQDKLLDSPGSAFIGDDGSSGGTGLLAPRTAKTTVTANAGTSIGVVRGYSGSQVFDTTYATVDPSEPPHCGVTGGASYWLAYQPPTNGTITLDTIGSTFDTVLEAYTYNGTLTGYSDLISITCDNNSANNNGAARVTFPVVKTRQYVIVVDGVNGARGTAYLNYFLNTNVPPLPPALTSPPGTVAVTPGSPATIAPSIAGCPPLRYSWKKNQAALAATNAFLFFAAVTTNDAADYVVTATNDLGTLTATYPLHVVLRPNCSIAVTNTGAVLEWATIAGLLYTVEEASAPSGPWSQWTNSYAGDGKTKIVQVAVAGARFFRLRVQ